MSEWMPELDETVWSEELHSKAKVVFIDSVQGIYVRSIDGQRLHITRLEFLSKVAEDEFKPGDCVVRVKGKPFPGVHAVDKVDGDRIVVKGISYPKDFFRRAAFSDWIWCDERSRQLITFVQDGLIHIRPSDKHYPILSLKRLSFDCPVMPENEYIRLQNGGDV